MDQKTAVALIQKYRTLLAEEMAIKEVILFGSYAKGTAHENSDLDVAVIVSGIEDDFFAVRPLMWKIRRSVDDRIEPVLFTNDRDDSGFLAEIRKTGIQIQ